MLFGRAAERVRVLELLARARAGTSAALLITGEPGIGKSALLDDVVDAVEGMTVLRARGVESESELPFAGLAELLAPVLDRRWELPAPQVAALEGAFALGPSVAGDRFTAYVAILSLVAATAERVPVLAVVDDVHWVDTPSRAALAFVARRLREDAVALLLTTRPDEPSGFEAAGLPVLELGGLDLGAARDLLAAAGGPVCRDLVGGLVGATGGNPLALLELSSLLSPAQRAGAEPIDDPLPVGTRVDSAFGRTLEGLPSATRLALLIAAVNESGSIDEVAHAMATCGLGVEALEPAERAGVVTITAGTLRFRHPLVRSLAYRRMPAPEQRAAHRAVAAAAVGDRSDERRAWHEAAATVASDEAVAAGLVEVAAAARARGGPAAAAPASERAARLTPDRDQRARRLLQAAEDRARLGPPHRARTLLVEALALAPGALLRADIQHLRGRVEERGGRAAAAAELLVAEATRVAPHDLARAAAMTMAAVQPFFAAGRGATAVATARRARELSERAAMAPMPAGLPLAMALLLSGDRPRARPLLLQAADWLERATDPWALGPVLSFGLGQAFTWLGEYDRASSILRSGIAQARASSAPAMLPYGLLCESELRFRTGHWPAAYAAGAEAAELAEQTDQPQDRAYALCVLARVEAALGREQQCRGHLATANELIDRLEVEVLRSYVGAVLGFLELGLGRVEAITVLEDLAGFLDDRPGGDPEILQWGPDLIEAYVRAGRRDAAVAAQRGFEHLAQASEGSWALATSARCRGLLATDDAFQADFREALDRHDTPFETARTRLCLGERLRRTGRRTESRAVLHDALRAFDRLGARPWADRTRRELGISGERPDGHRRTTEDLTPQELQVGLVIAQGATNREAAAALFLSAKTIEFHLRNMYRKLGIRSRTELVRMLLVPLDPP